MQWVPVWKVRVSVLALVLLCAGMAARGAAIEVVTARSGSGPLHVGDHVTITVSAAVQDPGSPQDGIFTFDQNLVVANVNLALPPVFEIVSIHRDGVDDLAFGGSDGTVGPNGVADIYGGYDATNVGIGTAAVLFTADLKAVSAGEAIVGAGPSTTPYGFDFLLYESDSPTVSYGSAVTLSVVPEPSAIFLSLFSMGLGLIRRRRQPA